MTTETNFGSIEVGSPGAQTKRPASIGVENGADPITFREVGLMPRISESADNPADELRRHALGYLSLTREQGEAFARNRTYYATLARRYGLTLVQIGEALGITEARVRQIVAGGRD